MTITKYTCLRFVVFFSIIAVLIIVCGQLWPGSIFSKWYTVAVFGIIFGGFEVYTQLTREHATQCLSKRHWKEIHSKLKSLGYELAEKDVDSMTFFRKVGFVTWEMIKVVQKNNYIQIELPDEHAEEFDQWLVNR